MSLLKSYGKKRQRTQALDISVNGHLYNPVLLGKDEGILCQVLLVF